MHVKIKTNIPFSFVNYKRKTAKIEKLSPLEGRLLLLLIFKQGINNINPMSTIAASFLEVYNIKKETLSLFYDVFCNLKKNEIIYVEGNKNFYDLKLFEINVNPKIVEMIKASNFYKFSSEINIKTSTILNPLLKIKNINCEFDVKVDEKLFMNFKDVGIHTSLRKYKTKFSSPYFGSLIEEKFPLMENEEIISEERVGEDKFLTKEAEFNFNISHGQLVAIDQPSLDWTKEIERGKFNFDFKSYLINYFDVKNQNIRLSEEKTEIDNHNYMSKNDVKDLNKTRLIFNNGIYDVIFANEKIFKLILINKNVLLPKKFEESKRENIKIDMILKKEINLKKLIEDSFDNLFLLKENIPKHIFKGFLKKALGPDSHKANSLRVIKHAKEEVVNNQKLYDLNLTLKEVLSLKFSQKKLKEILSLDKESKRYFCEYTVLDKAFNEFIFKLYFSDWEDIEDNEWFNTWGEYLSIKANIDLVKSNIKDMDLPELKILNKELKQIKNNSQNIWFLILNEKIQKINEKMSELIKLEKEAFGHIALEIRKKLEHQVAKVLNKKKLEFGEFTKEIKKLIKDKGHHKEVANAIKLVNKHLHNNENIEYSENSKNELISISHKVDKYIKWINQANNQKKGSEK